MKYRGPILAACLMTACSGGLPSRPSSAGEPYADITAADGLQYVRSSAHITYPELLGESPKFIFRTNHAPCPEACDSQAWDGRAVTCEARHIPADYVTLYVLDPATAGVVGGVHGAYHADSIYFRGHLLPVGRCEGTDMPPSCAILSIASASAR